MEIEVGKRHITIVCIYEMAGTALLVYALNVSHGNPIAVSFSLFAAILVGGPISGGHFNPAVSTGYFISLRDS
jgi:glycerol uptake facilitator-like aquaporin